MTATNSWRSRDTLVLLLLEINAGAVSAQGVSSIYGVRATIYRVIDFKVYRTFQVVHVLKAQQAKKKISHEIKNHIVFFIQNPLNRNNKTLKNYHSMPMKLGFLKVSLEPVFSLFLSQE